MKNLLITGVIAILGLGSAKAADMAVRPYTKAAPMIVDRSFDWTGFYLGGHVGYGWGKASADFPISFFAGDPAFPYQDLDGVIGGAQIGYNYQVNWLVLGVEGDFSGADIKQRSSNSAFVGVNTTSEADVKWLASVRGRVGAAFNSILIYGTGGAAWSKLQLSTQSSFAPGAFLRNWFDGQGVVHDGWVAGAGVEWAFSSNWIARAEYLHYEFDGKTHFQPSLVAGINHDLKLDVVRAGLSYKFGSPIVAKY